jgi:predicted O-methyltransferase YrrM/DNA-directed RNA polymerase subunit RPC12/RpoP
MKSMMEMDTVQIEITDACRLRCSNCTRFCGHKKPYFMSFDQFKESVDSMVGYPKMVGIMGGEPLLHPEFERFCAYARSKIPKVQLGLWTSLPEGHEDYRTAICDTFEHIFINDHTRGDVIHHPPLVAAEEAVPDRGIMWSYINHCWAQESWSASINPHGAWFCEIAAAMSMLFDGGQGWKVEPGWWWRIPKDFTEQMEMFCPRCGFAIPLKRRVSTGVVDDISPKNLERLTGKSLKVARGEYEVSPLTLENDFRPMATYKDTDYRNGIARRYGMFVVVNQQKFWTPHLLRKQDKSEAQPHKPLLEVLRERNLYKGNGIDGFMADDNLVWLFDIARKMNSIVEVGSWKGRSTHALLSGCPGTVWAVDHFKGSMAERERTQSHFEATIRDVSEDFLKNVGMFPNLKLLKVDSIEASKHFEPQSIDMVFIDGGHTYEDIYLDLEAWTPIARKMICGHDYGSEVKDAVDKKFGEDRVETRDFGLWMVNL